MDTQTFTELKHYLARTSDFSKIHRFFCERIDAPRLLTSGRPIEYPMIDDTLDNLLWKMDDSCQISETHYVLVAEHKLVLGSFSAEGRTGTLFYFEDTNQGFAAFAQTTQRTRFARFTLRPDEYTQWKNETEAISLVLAPLFARSAR